MSCLYNSHEINEAIKCIDLHILCYLTACEQEQHMLNIAESAITSVLIPKVEELLTEDNMNGGEHSMERKFHQGQQGLLYNGSSYLVNYQFAKGKMCELYRKAEIIPIEDARTVNCEGNKLVSMAEDLSAGMSPGKFAEKYRRNTPLKYKENLLKGLGMALNRVAEHGFPGDELVDIYTYGRGITILVTADKRIMDNLMYGFIGWNRQFFSMPRPKMENGMLIVGYPVIRYDITYSFVLANPERSAEGMKLNASIDLVYKVSENGRLINNIKVDFSMEETAKITALLKRVYFPMTMPIQPHDAPVTLGEDFMDNYLYEYGTPEQKKAVNEKWASTDKLFKRMQEISRRNSGK